MQDFEPIFDGALFERERDSNAILLPLLCGCAALTFTAGFGAWVLSTPPVSTPQIVVARSASQMPPARRVANPYGDLIALAAVPSPGPPRREANPYGVLIDLPPQLFAGAIADAPEGADRICRHCPRCARRPSAARARRCAHRRRCAAAAGATARIRGCRRACAQRAAAAPARRLRRGPPPDDRNAFQKLFGLGRSTGPTGSSLAYASPETAAVREQSGRAGDPASVSVFSRLRRLRLRRRHRRLRHRGAHRVPARRNAAGSAFRSWRIS